MPDEDERGLESQLLLARARVKLLGKAADKRVSVGRYRITERIGAGGMGIVYEAYDDELDRKIAIKVLTSELASTQDGRRRLVREAQAMARLSHPNVVHVYEIGRVDQQIFIAMELVVGETLRLWNDRERPWRDVLKMFIAAGRGLEAAHRVGLVHRDFKPDNVLVDDSGVPHVLDFGLAVPSREPTIQERAIGHPVTELKGDEITLTGTVAGTPAYMAPEQLTGLTSDHRADQFAFCVALFEALVGRRPFNGRSISELTANVCRRRGPVPDLGHGPIPAGVRAAIERGLSRDPDDRFPSIGALLEQLEAELSPRRSHRIAGLIGAGAVASAVALGGAWMTTRDVGGPPHPDPSAQILAESDLPPTIAEPLHNDPTNVTVHRLRNGLTVYVAPRSGEPSVLTTIVIRADGLDEREGQEGFAGMLNDTLGDSRLLRSADPIAEAPHLERFYAALEARDRISDAERRAQLIEEADRALDAAAPFVVPGEEAWLAEELGFGEQEFWLWAGSGFQFNVPRNRLDAWATIMAEGLRRPAFRRIFSTTELQLDLLRDDTEDAALVELRKQLASAASLTIDLEREAENISTLPFTRIREFWDTYYRPNNAAVVLVGDVTAAEVIPIVEAAFGDWEPGPIPPPRSPQALPDGERIVSKVVDDGPASVSVAWPRSPSVSNPGARAAIEDVILQRALARDWFEADGRARFVWREQDPMHYLLHVEPVGAHTLQDAQDAAFDYLGAVASGGIPAKTWQAATARADLAALAWGDSASALAESIADSFARRIPWREQASRLSGGLVTRDTVQKAARQLQRMGAVVVHREPGLDSPISVPIFDPAPDGPDLDYAPFPSPFAKSILDSPVTPLEPQFLTPGGDFNLKQHGNGRLLSVEDAGPTFRVHWILGAGLRTDPFTCDAWRAVVASRRPETDRHGISLEVVCGAHETAIHARGIASRWGAVWPYLSALLLSPELDDAAVRAHIARTLASRASVRTDASLRISAFSSLALMGEKGTDHNMPNDRALRASDRRTFERALAATLRIAPDALYAGPNAASFGDDLPPFAGEPPQRQQPRARLLDETTVFVFHDPERSRAEVQRTVALDITAPRDLLLADLLRAVPWTTPDLNGEEEVVFYTMLPSDKLSTQGIAFNGVAECAHDDVALVLDALTSLHAMPPRPLEWERARRTVEARYRAARRSGMARADAIARWAALDWQSDPAIETWLQLGPVTVDELAAYQRYAAAQPAIVSVIADLSRFNSDELKRFGRVVILGPESIRDVQMTDRRVWDPELELP